MFHTLSSWISQPKSLCYANRYLKFCSTLLFFLKIGYSLLFGVINEIFSLLKDFFREIC